MPVETSSEKSVRFAIVGTWGVPARYGGFETLAEQLARNIPPTAAELVIYGERSAYSEEERVGPFFGHERVWLPFSANGFQSILHDALQLMHAAIVGRHDRILILGTSGVWALPLLRAVQPFSGRRIRVVCNIDGLEWRRDKFGPFAKGVLKGLEWVAVRFSDMIVADNAALVPMIRGMHGIEPNLIAYGGDHIHFHSNIGVENGQTFLAIARIEPENNSEMILQGVAAADGSIVYVGNWSSTAYGRDLLKRFGGNPNIVQKSAVYDQEILSEIRSSSSAYVHGHSVGGTNPSLVEATFHSNRILAFDCDFNRATLEGEGAYFRTSDELADLLRQPMSGLIDPTALLRLRKRYQWKTIASQYLAAMNAAEEA